MTNSMEQLFKKLGYNRHNGLFYLKDAEKWTKKFPYRISRVLKDIIRPFAFFSPYHGELSTNPDHPAPLNNPIILFFNQPDAEIEQDIPRWSFCFGQAPVVIINREDSLEIYHGYDFDEKEPLLLKKIEDADAEDFSVLNLTTGKTWEKLFKKYYKNTPKVDKYLLKNIIDARRILTAKDTSGGLPPRAANRLIGRLLFIRYLIDRNVSFEETHFIEGESKSDRQKNLERLLKDKEKIYMFFRMITKSFNGDLFPLIEKNETGEIIYDEKKQVAQEHLDVMYYLFSCSEFFQENNLYKGYTVQRSLFNFYDFEVIPVELISNIYENFLRDSVSEKKLKELSRQEEIKAFYTPPFLVDYILSETVVPHLHSQVETSCRVLDPACGSGIFLVETLRKLIENEMILNQKSGCGNNSSKIPDERLWQLLQENIYGIDIDADAIEITIFSLYITLLDYKSPKEIKSFRFRKLKNVNLFGGKEADFFNEKHPFNTKFKEEVHLDFIIGNPPWGNDVSGSMYKEYIKNRKSKEKTGDVCELDISGEEISQAFMIRISDFASPFRKTKCALVVTGKNLYNAKAFKWRQYFLTNFCITKVFELSAINNKSTGGPQLFENAKQPPVVISFYPAQKGQEPGSNLVTHITARANNYWCFFKTIVIDNQDVKRVLQRYFMEDSGGDDWFWKVLLHGNILDFNLIKKLKQTGPTFFDKMKDLNWDYKGGLKPVDKSIVPGKRKDVTTIKNWKYIEINNKEDFRQFLVSPSKSFKEKLAELVNAETIEDENTVAQLPDIYFFKGKKLLLKNGLSPNFRAFAAVCEEDVVFSHSICSIKPKKGTPIAVELDNRYHTLSALFNSDLFTYFNFNTGTSAGAGRSRANFVDFFSFPILLDTQIGILAEKLKKTYEQMKVERSSSTKKELTERADTLKKEIEDVILDKYEISDEERALIDYTKKVSIPIYKRIGHNFDIYQPLALTNRENKEYLKTYAEVFIDHFGDRFNEEEKFFVVDIHISSSFIGIHFKIGNKPDGNERIFFLEEEDVIGMINKIGELGYQKSGKDLFIRQDIRGFNKNSFYVIKPNQRKSWHKALAYADLSEFVRSLVEAEVREKCA